MIFTVIFFPVVLEMISVHVLKKSSGNFDAGTLLSKLKRGISISLLLFFRLSRRPIPKTVSDRINRNRPWSRILKYINIQIKITVTLFFFPLVLLHID